MAPPSPRKARKAKKLRKKKDAARTRRERTPVADIRRFFETSVAGPSKPTAQQTNDTTSEDRASTEANSEVQLVEESFSTRFSSESPEKEVRADGKRVSVKRSKGKKKTKSTTSSSDQRAAEASVLPSSLESWFTAPSQPATLVPESTLATRDWPDLTFESPPGSADEVRSGSQASDTEMQGGFGKSFLVQLHNGGQIKARHLAIGMEVRGPEGLAKKVLAINETRQQLCEVTMGPLHSYTTFAKGPKAPEDRTDPDLPRAFTSVVATKETQFRVSGVGCVADPFSFTLHPSDNDALAGLHSSGPFAGYSKALVSLVRLRREGELCRLDKKRHSVFSFITGIRIPETTERARNVRELNAMVEAIWPRCQCKYTQSYIPMKSGSAGITPVRPREVHGLLDSYDFTTWPEMGGDFRDEHAARTAVTAVADQIIEWLEKNGQHARKTFHDNASHFAQVKAGIAKIVPVGMQKEFKKLTFRYQHGVKHHPVQVELQPTSGVTSLALGRLENATSRAGDEPCFQFIVEGDGLFVNARDQTIWQDCRVTST